MKEYHDIFMKIIEKNKENIEKKLEKDPNFLDTLMQKTIESNTELLYKSLEKDKRNMLNNVKRITCGFNKRLYKTWKNAFDNAETLIELSTESAEMYIKEFYSKAKAENNLLFYTLKKIHARAILTSKECLVLLKNGYPDGAFSRWRTLHELCVIAMFLFENKNNDLCESYIDFFHIQAYNEEKVCREKGYPTHTDESFRILKANYDYMINKYGKIYNNGEYGWANNFLKKTRTTFKDIEDSINMGKFRGYYKSSSAYIYGNFKASEESIGIIPNTEKVLLIGPSNYGLSIPIQNVVISLYTISIVFLSIYPTIDTITACYIMNKFMESVLSEANKIQIKLEEDEKKILEKGNAPQ